MTARGDRTTGHTDAAVTRRVMWRFGLQAAGCVAAIVALLCGVAVAVVLHVQHTTADTLLTQSTTRADDVTDPPAGEWLVMRTPHGTIATPGLPRGLPDTRALAATARTGRASTADLHTGDDREYRVRTQQRGTTTVQAILSLAADHRERARLVLAMLVSGGVGLLLAVGAGLWFGRRAVRPIAAALALQRRFVTDASHELRTPLTLLSTRAQLLRRHYHRRHESEGLAEEIDGVVADAGHLTDILEDLLLAAEQTAAPQDEPVDLSAVVADVVAACRSTAAQRSITVEERGAGPVLVPGSPAGLRRALTALVDNAVRHARRRVGVHASRAGSHAVVEVVDDGPGIAPEVLPHVFERFTSLAPHPAPGERRRYGLGLALVTEVAGRHGGTVTAENRTEGGAILRLTLPTHREKEPRRRHR